MVTHTGKAVKEATQDVVDAMLTSTSTGFGHLTASLAASATAWHAPLDASDYGARPNAVHTDGDFLKAAAGQLTSPNKASKPADAANGTPASSGSASGAGLPEPAAAADRKTLPCDPVVRNKVVRCIAGDLAKELQNLRSAAKGAGPILFQSDGNHDKDSVEILNQRLLIAHHCVGAMTTLAENANPLEKESLHFSSAIEVRFVFRHVSGLILVRSCRNPTVCQYALAEFRVFALGFFVSFATNKLEGLSSPSADGPISP